MSEDIIRVVRVMEYQGPRSIIEHTLANGAVPANGEHRFGDSMIRSAMLGSFAEIVARVADSGDVDPNHGG